MNQPVVINLQCVPAGVELILAGLGKMPYEQSAPLIAELHQQYQAEMRKRIDEAKAEPVGLDESEGGHTD